MLAFRENFVENCDTKGSYLYKLRDILLLQINYNTVAVPFLTERRLITY